MADTGFVYPTDHSSTIAYDNWTNPGNALADGGGVAETVYNQLQNWHDFGDPVPAGATIDGIIVRTEGASPIAGAGSVGWELNDTGASVIDTTTGDNYSYSGIGFEVEDFGSSTDLWGRSWTSTQANNITIIGKGLNKRNQTSIDYVQIRIYYTAGGYGHDVNGVDSGDISKVVGVATADIDKVIGT